MYHKLFDLLYSFDADTIEQAVDLGETLGYWEQYKDKNITDRGMHIWHLQMDREVWENLRSSHNGRKSISFPAQTKAHVWGKGLERDDVIHESKIIKLTRRKLRKLIKENLLFESVDPRIQRQIDKVLLNNWKIVIDKSNSPDFVSINVYEEGQEKPISHLKMTLSGCYPGLSAYTIGFVKSSEEYGIGPLLFDLALETAYSINPDYGIYTTRGSSQTPMAAWVWYKYLDRSGEVTIKQIPVEFMEDCTPDEEAFGFYGANVPDDLSQYTDAMTDWGMTEEFWMHPKNIFSKVFYKKNNDVTSMLSDKILYI